MSNEADSPTASKLIRLEAFRQVCLQIKDQSALPEDSVVTSEEEKEILKDIDPSLLVSLEGQHLLGDLERLRILKPIFKDDSVEGMEDETSMAESVQSTKSASVIKLELPETSELFKDIQSKTLLESLLSQNRQFPKKPSRKPPMNYAQEFIPLLPSPDLARVDQNDLIMTVAVWHPRKRVVMSEFHVYGAQMLSSLKDSISCLSDSVQLSVEPRSPRHRSGYFFIENVFYNDLRDPECIDYSEPIIQWIQTKERASQPGLGMYETARIDQVRFIDLTLRLNYPYLYCHQGNCEHLLIFKEIRLVHPTDPPHQVSYPLQTYSTKTMPPVCQICQLFPGERVTWNDLGAPDQPYVWCHQCFQEFHFDAEGRVLLPHESLEVRLLEDEPPFGNPPEIPENP